MAIGYLKVQIIKRSEGRSATAAAAYRAGIAIDDERTGQRFDYSHRRDVLASEIVLPEDAPPWAQDRRALWNAAEQAERKSNSRVAREMVVALPHELTHEQRFELTRQMAEFLCKTYGAAVDFSLHAPDKDGDQRNFHAHILFSTRRMGKDGFGDKTRELDDKAKGPQEIDRIRSAWTELTNQAMERSGQGTVIDLRSYKRQGVDRQSQTHLGPGASELERQGKKTRVGDHNRAIQNWNRERAEMEADIKIIDFAIEREKRRMAELEKGRRAQAKFDPIGKALAELHGRHIEERADIILRRDLEKESKTEELDAYYGIAKLQGDIKETEVRLQARGLKRIRRKLSGAERKDREKLEGLRKTLDNSQTRITQYVTAIVKEYGIKEQELTVRHAKEKETLEAIIRDPALRHIDPMAYARNPNSVVLKPQPPPIRTPAPAMVLKPAGIGGGRAASERYARQLNQVASRAASAPKTAETQQKKPHFGAWVIGEARDVNLPLKTSFQEVANENEAPQVKEAFREAADGQESVVRARSRDRDRDRER